MGNEKERGSSKAVIIALIAAVTAIICALVFTVGFVSYKQSAASNGLTASGSASTDFEADLIVWRGTFSAYGETTQEAYAVIKSDSEIVKEYLAENGITEDEMVFSSVQISPCYTTEYDANGNYVRSYTDGYNLYQELTVTSSYVDKVEQVSRDITTLIEAGVEFISDSPEYYYTKLDEIKLALIEMATSNAKQRIDIMAAGAGTKPGKLLTASLGVFQITATNSGTGEYTYDGAFDTSSRYKTATITVRLNYTAK